jgi:hypothetical protein
VRQLVNAREKQRYFCALRRRRTPFRNPSSPCDAHCERSARGSHPRASDPERETHSSARRKAKSATSSRPLRNPDLYLGLLARATRIRRVRVGFARRTRSPRWIERLLDLLPDWNFCIPMRTRIRPQPAPTLHISGSSSVGFNLRFRMILLVV